MLCRAKKRKKMHTMVTSRKKDRERAKERKSKERKKELSHENIDSFNFPSHDLCGGFGLSSSF
jgi:hypothetical protein